jgi:hypothetical protein
LKTGLALLVISASSALVQKAEAHTTGDIRGCSKQMSGSAIISDREYSSGEFEFKIKPSLASGIVTAIGLANDGTKYADPFVNLLFDGDNYGVDTFAVQLGGMDDLFG